MSATPHNGGGARPFLKWVGGKRQLLPELLSRAPSTYGVYHEPFVGGGALFFALAPKNGAVLSDANLRLIRTYRAIRDDVEGVIETLLAMPYERQFFLAKRAEDPNELDDVGCAAWFIYLNKTGFNGLYRVNRAGRFNVPFGRYTNPTICDEGNLRACSAALASADILHDDFRGVLERANDGDFVYFDPPYVPLSGTSDFTSYTAGGFRASDHEALRDVARCLKGRGVHVLLSNSSAPAVADLYASEFEVEQVSATRAINSKAAGRGAVKEVLIR